MKYLLGIVVFFGIAGYFVYLQTAKQIDDSKAIKKFVETRGTSPLPRSWVGKIGEGI